MKVTINFSESAYKSEVINNGVSIKPSVTVEFTAEQVAAFSKEQRDLLIKYTEPKNGTSRFDEDFVLINPYEGTIGYDRFFKYGEYTEDVFHIINDCERKVEENRSSKIAEVIEYNNALKAIYSCGEYYAKITYLTCRTGHGFSPYISAVYVNYDYIRVNLYDGKTPCADMVARFEEWNTGKNIGVTRETIIQQLQALCVKVYEEKEAERKKDAERKAADEQRRKDAEAKQQADKAFKEEWIMNHGSKRLKALMENEFYYEYEYRKEYAAFMYGPDAHLDNEKYNDDNDYDDITSDVKCPSEEHLEKFLAFQSEHPGVDMILEYQSEVPSDIYDDENALLTDVYDEDSTVFVRVNDEHIGRIYVEL